MALKTQAVHLGKITPTLPADQGKRLYMDMESAVQTHRLLVTVTALLDVTVANTSVRNKGSVLAVIDEVGVEEAGGDKTVLDGRFARTIAEAFAPSALSATRKSGTGTGQVQLTETFAIHYASPISVNPAETTFRERNVKRRLQFFVKLRTGNLQDQVVGGGTATLTGVNVTVRQVYDDRSTGRPFYIPTYRQQTVQVTGTNPDLKEIINTESFIRLMGIQQDSDVGEVGDLIKALELHGDRRHIIGPGKVPWDDLARDQEAELGGAVYSGPGTGLGQNAYLILNFQKGGRLSNIINPQDDTNLRFRFDVAASGVAGATNGRIRIAICELGTHPELTRPEAEARELVPA